MKKASAYFLSLLWFFYSSFIVLDASFEEGFLASTLVKTPDGYKTIEDLCTDDILIGCDDQKKAILGISQQHIAEYIKILLENETICAAPHQKFYNPIENTWIEAQDITPSHVVLRRFSEYLLVQQVEKIHEPADVYALAVEDHNFCVTPDDIQVHNADTAYEYIGLAFTLGRILIKHPVVEIVGTLIDIGRACLTMQQQLKNIQEIKQKTSVVSNGYFNERTYYEYMLVSLCSIRDDFLRIKTELEHITMNRWHGISFTTTFMRSIQPLDTTLCKVNAAQEYSYNEAQKIQLRNARQAHFEYLQHQIRELQIALTLHFNELIDQLNRIKTEVEQQTLIVEQLAQEWNKNKAKMLCAQAIVHYENECLLDVLLEELEYKSQELKCVIEYYARDYNASVLKKTTNITQLFAQERDTIKSIEALIVGQRKTNEKYKQVTEIYFQQQRINIKNEKHRATTKAKKRLAEKKAVELAQAEAMRGSIKPPEDPKKRNTEKVATMRELFTKNDFGKELAGCCRKTKKIDAYTNSQVYEMTENLPEFGLKRGDEFYLDKFHGDHLEVFRNESGHQVLNIDGSQNITKTLEAAGRRLATK